MEKKLEEIAKNDKESVDEYFAFVKEEVNEGRFFKDAIDWYLFRYVSPICDRTILIIGGILSIIICYVIFGIIEISFPLVVRDPIIIKAKDQSKYLPNLIQLKPKSGKPNYDPNLRNIDEAIVKYLISIYINDRESYNFSKASIEDVNTKINRIKNISSVVEFKNFQNFFSEENPLSPIQNFGKNIKKNIEIIDFKFIRKKEDNNNFLKLKNFFNIELPTEAQVKFDAIITANDEYGDVKTKTEKYLVKVKFNFLPVHKPKIVDEKNKNKEDNKLKFMIESYKLFRVKN
jgi:type IV secretory pathway component VirB8